MTQQPEFAAQSQVSDEDIAALEEQLGRVPRGVVDIAARHRDGSPTVVRTVPRLADGTPFPTTFYLTHPRLTKLVSTLEAEQVMAQFNERLAEDAQFAAAYTRAHEDYLERRSGLGEVAEIAGVSAGGMPQRVKCLHALLGHTLAVGRGVNPVGDEVLDLLAQRWNERPPAGGDSH